MRTAADTLGGKQKPVLPDVRRAGGMHGRGEPREPASRAEVPKGQACDPAESEKVPCCRRGWRLGFLSAGRAEERTEGLLLSTYLPSGNLPDVPTYERPAQALHYHFWIPLGFGPHLY